ncbi:MAG: metal-sensitive transcriptional regulator [Patescibacteria group bacterium]
MTHTHNKPRLIRRLKIIEGQVRGLQKMVQDDAYCVDVITQSLAVKSALSGVEDAVLEGHLSSHVVEQMRGGKHEKAIGEILKLYKLSKKK